MITAREDTPDESGRPKIAIDQRGVSSHVWTIYPSALTQQEDWNGYVNS